MFHFQDTVTGTVFEFTDGYDVIAQLSWALGETSDEMKAEIFRLAAQVDAGHVENATLKNLMFA